MGKNPAFQFYPGDWGRDLNEHPLEIEGAWSRICWNALWWSPTRGEATKTLDQWTRILSVGRKKVKHVLNYLRDKKIADIPQEISEKGPITIICRRMVKDEKAREAARIRKQRERGKENDSHANVTSDVTDESRPGHANVTSPPSVLQSSDLLNKKKKQKKKKNPSPLLNKIQQKLFDRFWSAYPKKKSKGKAEKAWMKIDPDEELLEIMLSAIERAKKSREWLEEGGKYIPFPASWLNAQSWKDESYDPRASSPKPPLRKPEPPSQPMTKEEYETKLKELEAMPDHPTKSIGINGLKGQWKRDKKEEE